MSGRSSGSWNFCATPTAGCKRSPTSASGTNSGGDYNLVPLAGVQITAGYGIAKTDENGNFLLRDLPAGELTVTLVPQKDLPAGMKIPAGQVKMPAEPIQVQGATIVISNPQMTPYLLDAPKQ